MLGLAILLGSFISPGPARHRGCNEGACSSGSTGGGVSEIAPARGLRRSSGGKDRLGSTQMLSLKEQILEFDRLIVAWPEICC